MLMDINTLAIIQQNRHQELMRQAEQRRLAQMRSENNQSQVKAIMGKLPTVTSASLQEKLFALFQMRIRTVLPR